MKTNNFLSELNRIAKALERLSPPPSVSPDLRKTTSFLWQGESKSFKAIPKMNVIDLDLLIGLELQKAKLTANTKAFAAGYPANNALLWGARGMGKSSLLKAVHQEILKTAPNKPLILIEILREDIATLNHCLSQLQTAPARFILFCDDLSFDQKDQSYKSLKALLEGGIAGRPENVLFYATSNQRHLLSRSHSENQNNDTIHGNDAANEAISLSDRFGLWLGFHNCTPDEFKTMIKTYAAHHQIPIKETELLEQAHQWSMERGARSGRVAWQFIQNLLGNYKIKHK